MRPDRFHNKHSLIMSTGRGKMIVEFFSALILLRVWPDNCQSDCWCNWGQTSHSPAGTSAGAPRSSRPWRDWRLPGTWRPSARPQQRSPSLSPPWQPPPRRPSLSVAGLAGERPCCNTERSRAWTGLEVNRGHRLQVRMIKRLLKIDWETDSVTTRAALASGHSHFNTLHFDAPGPCSFIKSCLGVKT